MLQLLHVWTMNCSVDGSHSKVRALCVEIHDDGMTLDRSWGKIAKTVIFWTSRIDGYSVDHAVDITC